MRYSNRFLGVLLAAMIFITSLPQLHSDEPDLFPASNKGFFTILEVDNVKNALFCKEQMSALEVFIALIYHMKPIKAAQNSDEVELTRLILKHECKMAPIVELNKENIKKLKQMKLPDYGRDLVTPLIFAGSFLTMLTVVCLDDLLGCSLTAPLVLGVGIGGAIVSAVLGDKQAITEKEAMVENDKKIESAIKKIESSIKESKPVFFPILNRTKALERVSNLYELLTTNNPALLDKAIEEQASKEQANKEK